MNEPGAPLTVALVSAETAEVPAAVREELAAHGIRLVCRRCADAAALAAVAGEAEVVWFSGSPPVICAENLPLLRRCRALLRTGSGLDNVPVAAADRRGILVVNTPDAIAGAVADHAIALLFAAARRLVANDRVVRRGAWDPDHVWPDSHFSGQVLGLAGFGRIARAVAGKLSGFEMTVLAWDPYVGEADFRAHHARPVGFEELLARSDFLSVHCPLNERTRHLFGAAAFALMKEGAVFVNTARGAVVDEAALAAGLRVGRPAAAGLDVFASEPPERDNPLLALENVVLTPHIAAFSDQFHQAFWAHSVRAILALAAGRLPDSCANPAAFKARAPRRGGGDDA